MTPEKMTKIDTEELLRRMKPGIRTIGTAVGVALAVGEKIQARINSALKSLTFEKQLLARHDKLINVGLTEEQATATLKQVMDNMVAKKTNANIGR